MSDKLNLSADLMRIGEFLYQGQDKLAMQFIDRDIRMYSKMDFMVGKYKIIEVLEEIKKMVFGREKAAERALTASVILKT